MLSIYVFKWLAALIFIRLVLGCFIRKEVCAEKKSLRLVLFFTVWAYFYWLLGSIMALTSTVLMSFLSLLIALALLLNISKHPLKTKCFKAIHLVTPQTIIFWLIFIFAVTLRSYFPQLDNFEKYSDLALMQGVLLDNSFPPMDRWLSGYAINYYYFTHILFVPLVKLLNIPIEFAFNLMLSTVAALICSCTYELLKYYGCKVHTCLLSVFLLFFAGNWEWVRWATKMHNYQGDFSWLNSSRAMPGVITEFPYFSFLLGDMHAHFVALLFLPLTLYIWMQTQKSLTLPLKEQSKLLIYFFAPLLTGLHFMANSWQMPFMLILCIYAFYKNWKYLSLHLFLAFFYFIYFFALYQTPGKTGIFYISKHLRSPWPDFVLHWGPFTYILLIYACMHLYSLLTLNKVSTSRDKKSAMALIILTIVLGIVLGWVSATLILLLFILFKNNAFSALNEHWHKAVLLLSLLTLLGCEFISVDATLENLRINTVFKFYYLAWWGMAFALPVYIEKSQWTKYKAWPVYCVLGAGLSLYYPIRATAQRISNNTKASKTLDGMRAWSKKYPGQREAVNWLRENTLAQDILWELMGGVDHSFAKFSTFSGRPSVFGWYTHQLTWRKNGKELFIERLSDFVNLNKQPNKELCDAFIRKYRIKWIVLSAKEQEKYSPDLKEVLATYPVAFDTATVKIFKAQ